MKLNQILPLYLLTEDKISYLNQNMGDKILSAYRQDDIAYENNPKLSSEDILKKLQKADVGNKYLQWIANQYIKRSFRLEDLERVYNAIKQFHNNKTQLQKKDINQYSLHELEGVVGNTEERISKRQQKQQIKTEGADVVMSGVDGVVLKLKTREAACYYGKGTKWCTAADENNMFEEYNNRGPLYVFIGNNGRKFQFHVETRQYMDENDRHTSIARIRKIYPTVDKFFNEISKKFANDPKKAYFYAKDVINGRFREAEKAIAGDPEYAYFYANNIINGRFPEGEKVIASDPLNAYRYAATVINGRFPEGEKAIASDPLNAYRYANNIINGRFPEGETAIAGDPDIAFRYAMYVIKKRFPEGEKAIYSDPELTNVYVKSMN